MTATEPSGRDRTALQDLSPADLLHLLPVAVYVCDGEGRIQRYNARAAELWGRVPDPDASAALFFDGTLRSCKDGQPIAFDALPAAEAMRTATAVPDREYLFERPDGSIRVLRANAEPIRAEAGVIGAVASFFDITDRHRAEQEAARRGQDLEDFFENGAVGLHWVAGDGTILRANRAELELLGYPPDDYVGRPITDFHADPPVIADILARLGRGETLDKYPARLLAKDGSIRHVLISSNVQFRDGAFVNTRCFTLDVTEQHLADERQRLLLDELNHRVKNTVATVQAIATQTLKGAPDTGEFVDAFTSRMLALSSAHDLLAREVWEGARLGDLASSVVLAYASPDRVVLDGPADFRLGPTAAVTLAMAFHELATNAARYGALSADGGRVTLTWDVAPQGEGKERRLVVRWAESGGPPVTPPTHRGFGLRLLKRGLAQQLEADVELGFEPGGLRAVLAMPINVAQCQAGG